MRQSHLLSSIAHLSTTFITCFIYLFISFIFLLSLTLIIIAVNKRW